MKQTKSLLIGIIALITLTGCSQLLVDFTAKVLIPLGSDLVASPFKKPKSTVKCKNGTPDTETKYIENYEKFALNLTNYVNNAIKSSHKLAKEEFDKGSKFVTLSDNPNYGTYIISLARKTPFKELKDRQGLYAKENGLNPTNNGFKPFFYAFTLVKSGEKHSDMTENLQNRRIKRTQKSTG